MTRGIGRLGLMAAGVVALMALVVSAGAPQPVGAEEALDGKTLFVETHKCNQCHSVGSADIEAKTTSDKMKGPDLSGYKWDGSIADLAAYVRKTSEREGKSHKLAFKGSDEELQAIIDWLGSLEAQE